jgi:hypothetical protein
LLLATPNGRYRHLKASLNMKKDGQLSTHPRRCSIAAARSEKGQLATRCCQG